MRRRPRAGDEIAQRAKRDHAAARALFERAIGPHDVPEKVAVDKSGSNKAAIVSIQADIGLALTLRQLTYLNNIVEQDHRAVKRVTHPMLGFKNFRCARILIAGIETMPMIRKGPLAISKIEPRLLQTSSTHSHFNHRIERRPARSHDLVATEPRETLEPLHTSHQDILDAPVL